MIAAQFRLAKRSERDINRSGIHVYEKKRFAERLTKISNFYRGIYRGTHAQENIEWSSGKVSGWRDAKFKYIGRIAMKTRLL